MSSSEPFEKEAGAPVEAGAPAPAPAPKTVTPHKGEVDAAAIGSPDADERVADHDAAFPPGGVVPEASGQGSGDAADRSADHAVVRSPGSAVIRPVDVPHEEPSTVEGQPPAVAGSTAADATTTEAEATPVVTTTQAAEAGPTISTSKAPAPPAPAVKTTGTFEAYTVGEPGRAFTHGVSLVESKYRDAHDFVIDAAVVPDVEGTPRLELRAASCRGLSHQQYGDPRQDDHCVMLSGDGEWLVCLVSDGVSSGEWSHLAAKMVTEEGAAHLSKFLETHEPHEIPYREVFLSLADLLADVCATLPDSEPAVDLTPHEVARRMAATLVVAIIGTRPCEDGTHPVTVVRLGDTSAWILDSEEGWINLGEVKNAGQVIAGSATASLPLVPAEDPVPVQTTLGAGAALILMTDGVGDPLGSGKGEVGQHLATLWARPPHPLEFAAQAAFGRKTYDDDRGVIGVWLAGGE